MTVFISLLRGINVSGQKKMPMAELRVLYGSLGFTRVTTYIQSGNVVFASAARNEEALARRLEAAVADRFGFPVPVIIRSLDAWRSIVRRNPFLKDADPAHLHVACLARPPAAGAERVLAALNPGADAFAVDGCEIFLHCPNGYARTKLTNTVLEKKLGTAATTRNWKTVGKLLMLAQAASSEDRVQA